MKSSLITVLFSLAAFLSACAPNGVDGRADNADLAASAEEATESAPETGGSEVEIGATGGMCGGIAGFECEQAADYCAMADKECLQTADAAGVCKPKPEACTLEYDPVCGCDGETYSNKCMAALNGVSVGYPGECRAYD